MTTVNYIVAITLGLATAAVAAFLFLGSSEEHALLVKQHLWQGFGWRFYGFGVLGLIAAACWWGLNVALLKTGVIKGVSLGRTAVVLAAGPIVGAFLGTVVFCFV
ncbi:hypothetical protein [Hymenobacter negativus]|uniref:hypothetical protein n=1 Tax=Hymenobacter negativus TaxID=2795026 RepID=UPI001AAFB02C|nr:hypothetical protein [Hymenobacter negativus]